MNAKRLIVFGILILLFYFAELHRLSYSQYAGSEQPILSNGELIQTTQAGSSDRRIGVLLLGIVGILMLLKNRSTLQYSLGGMEAAILLFLLWMVLSIGWSDDVVLAVRRATSFVLLWVAALGFASEFDQRDSLRFMFAAGMSFVLLGLGAELVLGTFTPNDPLYRFSGTLQPNHQAWSCGALALASMGLATTERRYRKVFLACMIFAMAALVLTKSRTGVAAFAVAAVLYLAMTATRKWKLFYAWAGVSICLIAFLFNGTGSHSQNVLLLGRDSQDAATLTGRTEIWNVGIRYFAERPFRGYGFNAFETPQRIAEFEREAGWAAITLHSEYLDLLLGVGLVGFAVYLLIIAVAVIRTMRLYRAFGSRHYAIELSIIICMLCIMVLENVGRDPNVFAFMFFVIVSRRVLWWDGFRTYKGPLTESSAGSRDLKAGGRYRQFAWRKSE